MEYNRLNALQKPIFPPFAYSISIRDLDAALRQGPCRPDGKWRIYRSYQQNAPQSERISIIKQEYGTSGGICIFPDGIWGQQLNTPKAGIRLSRADAKPITYAWDAIERQIGLLIERGAYLTKEEKDEYLREHPPPD